MPTCHPSTTPGAASGTRWAASPRSRRRRPAGARPTRQPATRSSAGTARVDAERAPETQVARLVEQGLAIDADPALHFVHIVVPHAPWFATPWGTRLMPPMPEWVEDPNQPGYAWSGLIRYQRHSLQTGLADAALGEVLDHLESSPFWEDTTLVVVADHGTSTIQPDVGREITDANVEEVLRVPFFLKAPGQVEGKVVDDVANLVDLLPTMIDLMDADTDWTFEGHSLLDGSEPTLESNVSPDLDEAAGHRPPPRGRLPVRVGLVGARRRRAAGRLDRPAGRVTPGDLDGRRSQRAGVDAQQRGGVRVPPEREAGGTAAGDRRDHRPRACPRRCCSWSTARWPG